MFEENTRCENTDGGTGFFHTVIQDTLLVLLLIEILEPYCGKVLFLIDLLLNFNQLTFLSFIAAMESQKVWRECTLMAQDSENN